MFDLHIHSLASDGKADFTTVLRRLREQPELQLVALTDHDAIIDSTRLAALEARAWIGSELTTKHGKMTVDMLALNVRPDYAPLNTYLAARKIDRVNRFDRFGVALRTAGWSFDPPASVYDNPQLAKPHVVAELRRHPDNAERLAALGVGAVIGHRREDDVIYNEVIDPLQIDGDLVISITDAIALTHAAGGLAMVAHPWIAPYVRGTATVASSRAAINGWARVGLDGLEVFHESAVDPAVRAEIMAQVLANELLISVGSDDHSEQLEYIGSALPAHDPRAEGWLAAIHAAAERRRAVKPRSRLR